MANKKPSMKDLFTSTDKAKPAAPQDNSDLDTENIKPMGVGLRGGEIKALDAISAENGNISRNALLRFAARQFIVDYRAGKIDLSGMIITPPPQKKKLQMPS